MLPTLTHRSVTTVPGLRLSALLLVLVLVLSAVLAPLSFGAGGNGGDDDSGDPRQAKAKELIRAEQFADAERVLREWAEEQPESADAHNLLGYVARKLGRLQAAVQHYREALRLDPEHRGAHEYLGETWLALDDLAQAKVHLAFLDDDCWLPCAEYSDLKKAVEQYEQRKQR